MIIGMLNPIIGMLNPIIGTLNPIIGTLNRVTGTRVSVAAGNTALQVRRKVWRLQATNKLYICICISINYVYTYYSQARPSRVITEPSMALERD